MKARWIKVFGDSVNAGTCRVCQQPVVWAKAVTRARWILFDGAVVTRKQRIGEDGQELRYFSTGAIHWSHCPDGRRSL